MPKPAGRCLCCQAGRRGSWGHRSAYTATTLQEVQGAVLACLCWQTFWCFRCAYPPPCLCPCSRKEKDEKERMQQRLSEVSTPPIPSTSGTHGPQLTWHHRLGCSVGELQSHEGCASAGAAHTCSAPTFGPLPSARSPLGSVYFGLVSTNPHPTLP